MRPAARLFAAAAMVWLLSTGHAVAAAAPAPTVAVLYFDYDGKRDELAVLKKGLAQMLISDLAVVEPYQLVERERLQALLDEQKLAQSGKIDRATAARIGKLLGAQMMVMGGFFELGSSLRVDARLVDVETGRILATAGATAKNDEFLDVERKIADDLEQALRRQAAAAPATAPSAPTTPRPPRHPRPKPPAHLKTGTAIKYSQALAAADKGDRVGARTRLQAVLTDQPDFVLARADLERMMQ